ncbi:hypothetical protein Ciccas_001296 [Cichlidogyrus casuarinus]|uniref:Uncharacterized protein n=1 Tax=Cichlidogyrus casuarinus TaxID=1844966 RepID=A0ABD2QLL3_9PLAT
MPKRIFQKGSIKSPGEWITFKIGAMAKLADMITALFCYGTGIESVKIVDDEEMIKAFKKHRESVIDTIPKNRLLLFNAKDGWDPLCKFLGKSKPNIPYPHVNRRDKSRRLWDFQARVALVLNALLVLAFAIGLGSICSKVHT